MPPVACYDDDDVRPTIAAVEPAANAVPDNPVPPEAAVLRMNPAAVVQMTT